MPRTSEAALEEALVTLSHHAASKKSRSNWTSTFLTAARMESQGYTNSATGTDNAVTDLFKLVPGNKLGRINPFIAINSKQRWLQVNDSGRKTIWNNATRGNPQAPLFNGDHIENGLRADSISVLLHNLAGGPLPDRHALAILVTRDHDWVSEPSEGELSEEAASYLGLSVPQFEAITEEIEFPLQSVAGMPEWSPQLLEKWDHGPRDPQLTGLAAAGSTEAPVPVASVRDLNKRFRSFLSTYGIASGDDSETLDLLAATLSSQLIIMAGPSGSGKSLMASALSAFFATPDQRRRLEATRLLARREEFLGYFSHLAGAKFMAYDQLLELLTLPTASDSSTSPIITIEEANLSPIEGYLSPLIHGLGGIETSELAIPLHSQATSVLSQTPGVSVPPKLKLGPYPRFFATLNVDADSPAPARKVVSRSCVMLLETPAVSTVMDAADTLSQPSVEEATGPASGLLGRPTVAFHRYGELGGDQYGQAMRVRAELLRDFVGVEVMSPRSLNKSLMYIAWYAELSGLEEPEQGNPIVEAAANNALLHFVLPSLPAVQLRKALTGLATSSLDHGLLGGRVARLNLALGTQQFGPPPDFWGALS